MALTKVFLNVCKADFYCRRHFFQLITCSFVSLKSEITVALKVSLNNCQLGKVVCLKKYKVQKHVLDFTLRYKTFDANVINGVLT